MFAAYISIKFLVDALKSGRIKFFEAHFAKLSQQVDLLYSVTPTMRTTNGSQCFDALCRRKMVPHYVKLVHLVVLAANWSFSKLHAPHLFCDEFHPVTVNCCFLFVVEAEEISTFASMIRPWCMAVDMA